MDNEQNKQPAEDMELDLSQQPQETDSAPEGEESAAEAVSEEAPDTGVKPGFELKKLLKIAIPVVAALLVIVLICSSIGGSPVRLALESVGNTVEELGNSELLGTLRNTLQSGSVEAAIDLGSISGDLIGTDIDGSASVKLYTNAKDARAAAVLTADIGDTQFDARLYAAADAVIVDSASLLDGAIGINLKDAANNLPASIFNPDRDTDYAIDADLYDLITEILDKDLSKKSKELEKSEKSVLNEAMQALEKSLNKNAKIVEGTDKVAFEKDTVKVNTVRIDLNAKALKLLCEDMLSWAKDSKELRSMLEQSAALTSDLEDQVSDLLDATIQFDEDTIDDFYDGIDDLLEDIDDLEDDWENVELSLLFYISKSGKQLVKCKGTVDDGRNKYDLSLLIGPEINDPEQITLQLDDGRTKYTATYSVSANNSKEYSAKLKIREDSDTLYTVSFTWDKKDNTYRLRLTDEYDDEYSLRGTLQHKGKVVTLTIDRIELDDEAFKPGITLTLHESESVPSAPRFTDILDFTSEDAFAEFCDNLSDRASDFLDDFASLIY